jgi:predicted RNA-binding protein associated with RNAse of E/G family
LRPRSVTIQYTRPPDRLQVYNQLLIHEAPDHLVTFVPSTQIGAPVHAGDLVVLEPGAAAIWFTYPDRWYDIGRFHLADGTFTGFYANILTPVRIEGDQWHTTDLYLDVFVGTDGRVMLLDQDELDEAERSGWVTRESAAKAREQASQLIASTQAGLWPPENVREWNLERARALTGA